LTESAAFTHWESLVAWWVARRNESATIGRKHPPRKQQQLESGEVSGTAATEKQPKAPTPPPTEPDLNDSVPTALAWWVARRTESATIGRKHPPRKAPSVLDLAQQRMNDDQQRNLAPTTQVQDPAPNVAAPDEGGAVTDADIDVMKKAYAKLPPAASAWATTIMRQGNNGHPWNKLSVNKTVRRYELYRGVKTLAEWGGGAETTDEIIRAIVHAVRAINTDTDEPDPTIPPGQLLGTLGYGDATKFAQLAYDLATERYSLVYDDNGTPRLQAVT
jgi:hypothetical protein